MIQMTATTGLTVSHTINAIFQYIFDCLGFNSMNGKFDFVFQGLNRLWMVRVTLILNGSLQKIVQWGQITASRRPTDIRLLKPNVIHVILFNFWKQKFVEHGTETLAIDRNGVSLLIFEEKWPNGAPFAPNSHSLWVHRLLNDDVWIFRAPNATILLIGIASDVEMGFI